MKMWRCQPGSRRGSSPEVGLLSSLRHCLLYGLGCDVLSSALLSLFSLQQGELPLNAIQVLFEENEKTSFLIEGA